MYDYRLYEYIPVLDGVQVLYLYCTCTFGVYRFEHMYTSVYRYIQVSILDTGIYEYTECLYHYQCILIQ